MKDEIKIGQVWFRKDILSTEIKIAFVGKDIVVYDYLNGESEGSCTLKSLLYYYSPKKPEPTLKRLVAWVDPETNIVDVDFEDSVHNENWTKKELIVKDGSLYVDMSEV